MKRKLRIVFMGTPDFAVPSLNAILDQGFNVVGVVTAPDKPKGRGQRMSVSAVKKYSISKELNLLQPEKLKDPGFVNTLKELNANLFIVVAFRMLPEVIWSMPAYGTFNLHASLLPQYRGAAPINHSIINGDTFTGVTTFFINDKIDTGNIIFQERVPIFKDETAGELHDRLMYIGSQLLIRTVKAIETDSYTTVSQEGLTLFGDIRSANKIFKNDCKINWNQDVEVIYNFIRGLAPYPTAWSNIEDEHMESISVKFYKVRATLISHNNKTGSIETDNKNSIAIWAENGQILVDELQVSGKKRLNTSDFLNGFKLNSNYFFK